jgi:hypothetical protein
LFTAKGPPLAVTLKKFSGTAPELVTEISCTGLIVPTNWGPKVRPTGDTVTLGALLTPTPGVTESVADAVAVAPALEEQLSV